MDTPEEMRRKEVNRLYAKIAEHEQLEQGYIENTKKLVAALEATQRIVVSQQRQLNRQAIYAASAQDRITELEQECAGWKESKFISERKATRSAEDYERLSNEMNALYGTIDELRRVVQVYVPGHPLVIGTSQAGEAMERMIPKDDK